MLVRRCFFYTTSLVVITLLVYAAMNSRGSNDLWHAERIGNLWRLARNESICSPRSARRGFNQHVLSVSAYESNDRVQMVTSLTWSYIQLFVTEAKTLYPTWIVRVYYFNLIGKTRENLDELEKLHSNLDFCAVEDLPTLGNMRNKLPGKMQRFLPARK